MESVDSLAPIKSGLTRPTASEGFGNCRFMEHQQLWGNLSQIDPGSL